jgi:hypothetical protein
MARKKPELSPELKELVATRIAVLPKEDFDAFERYIVQLRKERAKTERGLPKLMEQLKAMGYEITRKGEEKKPEPTKAAEALKEIVKPGEAKAEEKKPAAGGGAKPFI